MIQEKIFNFKHVTLSFIIIIFFIVGFDLVLSLGVSPAKKTISFEPNKQIEFDFNIINEARKPFKVSLGAYGDLDEYIFFEEKVIDYVGSDYKVPFKVIVKLPPDFEPGIHKGGFQVNPISVGSAIPGFVALVAPRVPIYLRAPYPKRYLDFMMIYVNVDEGTPIPIYVQMDNLGSEKLEDVWGEVVILDPYENIKDKLITERISMEPNTAREIEALPSPILRKGSYLADVTAHYDGLTKTKKQNLTLGTPIIRVKELISNELFFQTINKIDFVAESDWNKAILVKGDISINNQQEEMPLFNLEPGKEKRLSGFFDTTNILPGEYNMTLTFTYINQIKEEQFLVYISAESKPESKKSKFVLLLLMFIFIIIIIVIILLFFARKRKKKGNL